MANSNILTGQYVHIEQTPASVGERIGAQIIDWIVQTCYVIGMFYLLAAVVNWAGLEVLGEWLLMYVGVLPAIFYGLLMELFNNGQTLGKRLLHMRVVRKDGSMPSLGAYLLRWMLMLIDGPTMSGLGLIVMLISKNNQRIGDLAAGTLVIKENSYAKLQVSLDEFDHFSRHYRPLYPAAENLSLEQVELIQQTLSLDDDDPRVHALAEKVRQTLGITQVHEPADSSFLWHIVRDYQYYALEEV